MGDNESVRSRAEALASYHDELAKLGSATKAPHKDAATFLRSFAQQMWSAESQRDAFKQQMIFECETRDERVRKLEAELQEVRKVYELIGEARSPGMKVSPVTPDAALEDMQEIVWAMENSGRKLSEAEDENKRLREENAILRERGCCKKNDPGESGQGEIS